MERNTDLYAFRHLTYADMRYLLDVIAPELTVRSSERLRGTSYCGLYDAETDTILISLGMTYTQKRCTLIHELVHREHGDVDGSHEMRTRLETAKILIDPKRLAVEETMYGMDYAQIAGHADARTAMHYQHAVDEHERQVINATASSITQESTVEKIADALASMTDDEKEKLIKLLIKK